MKRIGRSSAWAGIAAACLLTACGGGGGGSGDFGTGLSIDKAALSYASVAYETPAPKQTVLATVSATDAATIEVGYANGNENVSWLMAQIFVTAQNPVVQIDFIPTSPASMLTPGTYTAHPSIGIFRAGETMPIAVRTLTVTMAISPQPPSVTPSSLSFTAAPMTASSTATNLTIKGGPWTATVDYDTSGSGWLILGGSNVYPHSGPPAVPFVQFTTGPMAAGSYTATLNLAVPGTTLKVPVTLTVQ
jgi:hypothetical protein